MVLVGSSLTHVHSVSLKQEIGTQLIRPLNSKVRHPASQDVSAVQEILSPAHGKLNSLTLDHR